VHGRCRVEAIALPKPGRDQYASFASPQPLSAMRFLYLNKSLEPKLPAQNWIRQQYNLNMLAHQNIGPTVAVRSNTPAVDDMNDA
jgi:hypothetical protein